jgi:hypothetical protein
MGIRLVCPQGHKLHVKAFLAGKRAICPHCGEKVLVPLGNEAPTAGGESLPTGSPIGPETTLDLADLPSTIPDGSAMPLNVAASITTPVSSQPAAAGVSPSPLGIPPVAASALIPASDPIAEKPDAVWYVRPKTGGQYGPAPGAMMRQWINQSRVAADSLVWREGWAQWKTASDVFTELGAGQSVVPVTAPVPVGGLASVSTPAPSPATAAPPAGVATATAMRYHARRRSTGRLVSLIVVLGLLVIALAVVLVYVVQNKI